MPSEQLVPLGFTLAPIAAVSPSLAETLRDCPLQALLSRIAGIRDFVLGNPKAWLGTAYHEVLERIWLLPPSERNEQAIDGLWAAAIETLRQQAIAHPLNRRFSDPERWPGYHLAHACAKLRAKQALANASELPVLPGQPIAVTREQRLTAMNGKLVGKPDAVVGDEIRDYKSGKIFDDTQDGTRSVKPGYVRQLQLYGYLVLANTGRCPRSGKLLPMRGEPVEIELDAEACTAAADAAASLLDTTNSSLSSATNILELAQASPESCRWCQFKILCPAFWANVDNSWAENLGSAHVRGILTSPPTLIQQSRAYSLPLRVTAGTTESMQLVIAPLEVTTHTSICDLQQGDEIRLVNLFKRRDGQLAPTAATVCLTDSASPVFHLPTSNQV